MNHIKYNDKTYQCRDGETVLESLSRQGVDLSFSCRKGSCHVCMMRSIDGDLPAESQKGLRPVFKSNDYFLPCICKPEQDLVISQIEHDQLFTAAHVHKKEMLSDKVCRLIIESEQFGSYQAGQFINLSRPEDGLTRSYSLASCVEDYFIELHIERMTDGELSNWLIDELEEFSEVEIQGPNGSCYYQDNDDQSPMLMVATNTGLAPLLGILREALQKNHSADIHLYHQCRNENELYLNEELREIAEKNDNVFYYPCVTDTGNDKNTLLRTALNEIDSKYKDLEGWTIYLAGSNHMVSDIYNKALEKGTSKDRILSDTFDFKDLRKMNTKNNELNRRATDDAKNPVSCFKESAYPEPDLEIWKALDNGKKLNTILNDFYTIVYDDERLSPFFAGITKQRSIEKVYLFMRQILTGEKVFIGDRPRNAHHWMVISNDLFDYREEIMADCLRKNNIPENIVKRWRAIEEAFRPDIVKDKAWNKVVNGIEMPLDGYEEMTLDSGTMCDSCHQAIDAGSHVRYHVRLGEVYCGGCMSGKIK